MDWFNKLYFKSEFSKNKKSSPKKGFVKTAQSKLSLPSDDLDWKSQAEDDIEFGNFARYVFDSQTVKIFLTRTSRKFAVSLITNHTYLGTAGFTIFWSFNLDQRKEAEEVFKEVSEIARKATIEFIREEKPTVIFYSTLRQRLKHLKRGDVVRTNIPSINYSYDLHYAEDCRETIYGPRYPTHKEVSFDQYLNSSVYKKKDAPTGKFAL